MSRLKKYFGIAPIVILAGAASAAAALPGFNQPATQFVITVDGQFAPANEWSDVTPAAFISNPGGAFPTALNDPLANSYLYAAIGPGVAAGPNDALYLMYDYGGRTNPFTSDPVGSFIADVRFPLSQQGQNRFITVQVRSNGASAPTFQVDTDGDGLPNVDASAFHIEGAMGFGSSPHIPGSHEMVELEVPLLIPAGFGSGFPSGGLNGDGNGNGYNPAPEFWGAAAQKDAGDPPISSGIFTINGDGSMFIQPIPTIATPEPASLAMLAVGGMMMLRRRR